jgi:putative heme-binding domain-containing protein
MSGLMFAWRLSGRQQRPYFVAPLNPGLSRVPSLPYLCVASGLLLCAELLSAQGATAPAAGLARGREIFESQCGRCHGIDGGGGMGPNLRRPTLREAPDDTALVHLIADGRPARGMPGHWDLEEEELKAVARYVRSLGRIAPTHLSGDAPRGRSIFTGKGGCTACHMVDGLGGTLGPDLSDIGIARGPAYLRAALLRPGVQPPTAGHVTSGIGEYARFVPVRVVTADGTELSGERINEDTFTIQIRDAQGRLYSFDKSTLRSLDKEFGRSLMPSYASQLSAVELDDVIAYLAGLRGAP